MPCSLFRGWELKRTEVGYAGSQMCANVAASQEVWAASTSSRGV